MTGASQLARSVLALCLVAVPHAQAACTPSASLARELRATPSAAMYATLGSWYADHHSPGCAVASFQKAVALEPDSARYLYFVGLSLYADKQPGAAIEPLRHSLQLDPASIQTHLLLGTILEKSKDRRGAELEWRVALARDPNAPTALASLSHDLLADGNYSGVIALLHPRDLSGVLADNLSVDLAAAYSNSGLPGDAADLLETRLRASPASVPLAEALSGVLILESQFQKAVAVLTPLALQHPSDTHLQVLRLETLVLAHDPGAQESGKKLLLSAPHQPELLYFMGVLAQEEEDAAGARGYFERAVAAKPDYADAHERLGVVLSSLRDNTGARRELETAQRLGLDTPELHAALGKALRATGDGQGAEQQFVLYQQRLKAQAARAQAANKAEAGDQAAAAGHLQQTVGEYREALALDPTEPVLAFKLAMALDKIGDHAGERSALGRALALDSNMSAAENQLGYLDAGDGDIAAAVQHFQLAVAADPAFSKAWMNLAATLCSEARWSEARAALHHVVELEGENATTMALLQQITDQQAQAPH